MSEEVTYATLTFQNSAEAGNNQGPKLRKRGDPTPSAVWRWAVLSLITLCLLLLTGLVTLGIMYFQTSNIIDLDSEELSSFQKTTCQQQGNPSPQLSDYNFPTDEDFLKSQISNLLKKQEQMATKLCQQLVIEKSDHKCNPCPKMWQWHQNSCYYVQSTEEKTWSNSRQDCRDRNATLLKLDSSEEKDFLRSQLFPKLSFFWLGLSWNPHGRNWLWEDGSSPSVSFAEISWVCEKTAALVKIEDLN
ncbi:C-type lectin domain family 12 member B isoform X2 [Tenrec ecaudatus]|uniref:C-type lectin domain family 12 member B isoform X2 n=1 Tax=Tenrec ecaudatus TaxID=94439 RepID=UPI003F5AB781